MPRKNQPTVVFQPSQEELKLLDDYCKSSNRSRTDVLRELIRTLKRRRKIETWIWAVSSNRPETYAKANFAKKESGLALLETAQILIQQFAGR